MLLRDQMKEEAEQRVRGSLTLEAIAKAENIEAIRRRSKCRIRKNGIPV